VFDGKIWNVMHYRHSKSMFTVMKLMRDSRTGREKRAGFPLPQTYLNDIKNMKKAAVTLRGIAWTSPWGPHDVEEVELDAQIERLASLLRGFELFWGGIEMCYWWVAPLCDGGSGLWQKKSRLPPNGIYRVPPTEKHRKPASATLELIRFNLHGVFSFTNRCC
jgi:hypothetical protein